MKKVIFHERHLILAPIVTLENEKRALGVTKNQDQGDPEASQERPIVIQSQKSLSKGLFGHEPVPDQTGIPWNGVDRDSSLPTLPS